MQEQALRLLIELDRIFERVVNGEKDILDQLDNILIDFLSIAEKDLNDEIISMTVSAFNQKVNMIYKLCPQPTIKKHYKLEELQNEFKILEFKQFELNNNYVLGTIKVSDIEEFQKMLFSFREKLYAIEISDNNILEIAKMKSKIQHYETDILEDEDILRIAYQNSN